MAKNRITRSPPRRLDHCCGGGNNGGGDMDGVEATSPWHPVVRPGVAETAAGPDAVVSGIIVGVLTLLQLRPSPIQRVWRRLLRRLLRRRHGA